LLISCAAGIQDDPNDTNTIEFVADQQALYPRYQHNNMFRRNNKKGSKENLQDKMVALTGPNVRSSSPKLKMMVPRTILSIPSRGVYYSIAILLIVGVVRLQLLKQLEHLADTQQIANAPVGTLKLTKFDELVSAVHDRPAGTSNQTVPTARRVYNISEFPNKYLTNGGLLDTDRILLGKIYSSVNSSFEYGLGESTYIAAWTNMPRWSGVDSDSNWVEGVREKAVVPSHFEFNFGDIGPTKGYGHPVQPNLTKQLFRYVVAPLELEREAFDVYLVDGRWRVACACISFLHAIGMGADMGRVRVMMHDYDVLSRGYQIVEEEIADVVERSLKLAVFKLKPGTTDDDIHNLYQRYINVLKR